MQLTQHLDEVLQYRQRIVIPDSAKQQPCMHDVEPPDILLRKFTVDVKAITEFDMRRKRFRSWKLVARYVKTQVSRVREVCR